ncbi:hypothetical protein MASR2M15_13570 [Anaerolineales bacterium]
MSLSNKSWQNSLANSWIITRREVRDSLRDWRIITPIFILTFLFPFLAQILASRITGFLNDFGAELVGDRTIPFLLMIVGFFPISVSLVIALETFVGEKERKSLEPLLSTPLSNTELYVGKTLSAMIPPLGASLLGMSVYLFTLITGDISWRPTIMLITQIIILTIVQAFVMVSGAVVVSSQTTSTRAANLLASFIIIPMALIVNGEAVIMFLAPDAEDPGGISSLWAIIIGMIIVAILLLRMGNSIFNREELLSNTMDSISLRATFAHIKAWFLAIDDKVTPAKSFSQWLFTAVPYSFKKVRVPILISLAIMILALTTGYIVGTRPEWQLNVNETDLYNPADFPVESFANLSQEPRAIIFILWNNMRVLLAATLLSIFSFGIPALIIPSITFVVIGYIFSQFIHVGLSTELFWAGILPHGVIEIPALIMAAGILFYLGSVITRPPNGMKIGTAWAMAFGDVLKLFIALILPMFLISALIEVMITPQIIFAVMGVG